MKYIKHRGEDGGNIFEGNERIGYVFDDGGGPLLYALDEKDLAVFVCNVSDEREAIERLTEWRADKLK